jgi:hypothetical protein
MRRALAFKAASRPQRPGRGFAGPIIFVQNTDKLMMIAQNAEIPISVVQVTENTLVSPMHFTDLPGSKSGIQGYSTWPAAGKVPEGPGCSFAKLPVDPASLLGGVAGESSGIRLVS